MKRVTDDTRRRSAWQRIARFVAGFAGVACSCVALAQEPFPTMEALSGNSRAAFVDREAPLSQSGNAKLPGQVPSGIQQTEFSVENLLDEPLVDVVIEGNKTILPNAIMRYIETRPGRVASSRMIQQDVTALYNTRWFLSVRPFYRQTEAGPVLVFEVVERPILRSVQFKGNKKVKSSELQAHTGLRRGHGFDVAANLESVERIKQLYREKGYRFAEVILEKGGSKDDRDAVFLITEGPKVKIGDVNFYGNSFSRDGVLKTKISSKTAILWLIGGDYDPEIVRNDILALKQYYMNLGFFDVQIEAEEKFYDNNAKVAVNFKIEEGRRYRVREIDVVGNEVIGTQRLLSDLKLSRKEYFNARFLREDVNEMKDQYDDLGRLFATVEPTPRFLEDNPGWVDLVYQIDEDVPRYVGQINIHIRGENPHTKEDVVRLQASRYLIPGTLARGRDMRMAQARINGSGIWDRADPPTFDIKPTSGRDYFPSIATRGQSEDVTIEFTPRERTSLQETGASTVQIPESVFGHSGLTPFASETPKPVANPTPVGEIPAWNGRDQWIQQSGPSAPPSQVQPTHSGETSRPSLGLDPDMVFRGQSEPMLAPRGQSINGYGQQVPQDYMQGVSPQGDPFGDALSAQPPGFVDVNIDVTEGRTGRLMFGVGVNSDAGVVGSLVLQEDNFNILRAPRSFADIINGQAWRGAGQSFRMEAVPGSQVSRYMVSWQDPFFLRTDFSLGVSGFYYNRFFRHWTEDRLGGRLSVGYVLNRYWSVNTALRLEDVKVRDFVTPAPADLEAVRGDNFLSTGSVTLSYDTRDNAFVPSRGNNLDVTYEQGFGEFNYPRFDVSAGQYFTVYERPDGYGKHILAITSQSGWTGDGTPIFERYYAGGYSSFRGFAFRGVTPYEGNVEVGGNFMALGSVEYMIPITADDNIRTVLFSDFGTVEPDEGFDQFRASAGFGFRLVIPAMGPAPLAFDFAWPIMKEESDRTRVFSFYIGFTR
ncbi:MAG: BamA/TamA family outer membrane protein [Planctomycetaceae bacterium]|nr:BamA/TamA family outer membrane protein [Planctomycetaceae bacterium]